MQDGQYLRGPILRMPWPHRWHGMIWLGLGLVMGLTEVVINNPPNHGGPGPLFGRFAAFIELFQGGLVQPHHDWVPVAFWPAPFFDIAY